jgi:lincosamide nucleotidyltransferase
MSPAERQLQRLDEIARSLQARQAALALIGLGSVGRELERLDEYSDLDFFVIVEPGNKQTFLEDLDWLNAVHPIAYFFKNTSDGFKLLFEDRIFCEMAVFELQELVHIPYAPGRVIWERDSASPAIGEPQSPSSSHAERSLEWLLGEALTNLYVGLCRYRRGEKLSAARFIQGYAVDRVIELAGLIAQPAAGSQDLFSPERRFEQRYPQFAGRLDVFIQGYERSPQSAVAILAFLEKYFTVNPAMAQAILDLGKD